MKNLQTMKRSVQKGFTLIELMIVVAIIGILAAVAIPAYSDYTIKAKVSEGAAMSGAAKTAVDIYFSENGTLTNANGPTTLGISAAAEYKAKYVSAVSVAGRGVITITMKVLPELGDAGTSGTNTIIYTPVSSGSTLQWNVDSSTVPQKYRPKT